jgi:hypothetical protein
MVDFNSYEYLINSKKFLENIFSCKIKIYNENDDVIFDPKDRSKFANPLRPAIYIEQ